MYVCVSAESHVPELSLSYVCMITLPCAEGHNVQRIDVSVCQSKRLQSQEHIRMSVATRQSAHAFQTPAHSYKSTPAHQGGGAANDLALCVVLGAVARALELVLSLQTSADGRGHPRSHCWQSAHASCAARQTATYHIPGHDATQMGAHSIYAIVLQLAL